MFRQSASSVGGTGRAFPARWLGATLFLVACQVPTVKDITDEALAGKCFASFLYFETPFQEFLQETDSLTTSVGRSYPLKLRLNDKKNPYPGLFGGSTDCGWVTDKSTITTSDASVVSITGGGADRLLSAIAPGSATVTGTYLSRTRTLRVSVRPLSHQK